MTRFFLSLFMGLIIGVAAGFYIGWVQFPREFVESPASSLAPRYQDEYTVLVAKGFLADGDWQGSIDRLRILGVENVPVYVQEITERYITNSRDVNDIYALVLLADALGRLTPIMEPYIEIGAPAGASQ